MAVTVGAYLVQQAYSSGASDVVIAAVTVFDPLVSIGLGAALLGETPAPTSGVLALEILAAATAVAGIVLLARNRVAHRTGVRSLRTGDTCDRRPAARAFSSAPTPSRRTSMARRISVPGWRWGWPLVVTTCT
ncbi:hypothetical protein [Fodinicola feengrottensis]|uniref:hypothetical protein n=1 Tax=Fodinicola feengrottensis TaxID=435914 RepID=UPI0013D03317|nr:hypothetical protein [Fodinicola feengrottensis]